MIFMWIYIYKSNISWNVSFFSTVLSIISYSTLSFQLKYFFLLKFYHPLFNEGKRSTVWDIPEVNSIDFLNTHMKLYMLVYFSCENLQPLLNDFRPSYFDKCILCSNRKIKKRHYQDYLTQQNNYLKYF